MKSRFILLVLFFISLVQGSFAQQYQSDTTIVLSDTSKISLLTNSPWTKEVYGLFGHTAIRVWDPTKKVDLVFNYGLFSFDTPNFIFRFVKGNTDYMVASVDYNYYIDEYKSKKVGVTEQVLNLTKKEKQDIFNALVINSLPENREYRYNYFYDNCSTRPRDIIEKYIQGKVEYVPTNKVQTYRQLVSECVKIQPWTQFGIDLVIGNGADKPVTDREKDFLPSYLMNAFDRATIKDTDGNTRKVVLSTNTLLEPQQITSESNIFSNPTAIGYALLAVTILISLLVFIKRWFILGKIFDTLLFFVAGTAGCIIFFLMFFSTHPCTFPNWNIVWLNPLQLLVTFIIFSNSFSKTVLYYHFINFVLLLAFLLAWNLTPQQLETAFIPFILAICIRSGMNILQQKRLKKKAVYSLPKIR